MSLAIFDRTALNSQQKYTLLYYEIFLAGERQALVGDVAKRGLVFLQLARHTLSALY